MQTHLTWDDVDARLDEVEAGDRAGVVAVFLLFEGMALDVFDGRGARQTVNVSSFCGHIGMYRPTFRRWLRAARRETA